MNEIQAALAEQVKFLMADKDLRQSELARRVGISEKHLSQMLTGKVEGTLRMWQRLLDEVRK